MSNLTPLQKEANKLLKELLENKDEKKKENGIKCSKCNTTFNVIVRQTRSADEGSTNFLVCPNCRNCFKK